MAGKIKKPITADPLDADFDDELVQLPEDSTRFARYVSNFDEPDLDPFNRNISGRIAGMFQSTCNPVGLYWPKTPDPKQLAVTMLRILPMVDPEKENQFLPSRIRDETDMPRPMGAIVKHAVFTIPGGKFDDTNKKGEDNAGWAGKSFITYNPRDVVGQEWSEVRNNIPAYVLVNALYKASKSNRRSPDYWGGFIAEKARDKVKRPSDFYFAYGLCYARGDTDYFNSPIGLDPKSKPCVLALGRQVGDYTKALVRRATQEYAYCEETGAFPTGIPLDQMFAIPRPFGLRDGVFIKVYPAQSKSPIKLEYRDVVRWEPTVDESDSTEGYRTYLVDRLIYMEGRNPVEVEGDLRAHRQQLWQRYQDPIDSHLVFPDAEEQIRLISQHLRQPDTGAYCLDLLDYAFTPLWPNWRSYVPESVREEFAGHVQVQPGGLPDAEEEEDPDADQEATLDAAPSRGLVKRSSQPAKPGLGQDRFPFQEPSDVDPGAGAAPDEDDEEDAEVEAVLPPLAAANPVRPNRKPVRAPEPEPDEEDDDTDDDEDEDVEAELVTPVVATRTPSVISPLRGARPVSRTGATTYEEPPAPVRPAPAPAAAAPKLGGILKKRPPAGG